MPDLVLGNVRKFTFQALTVFAQLQKCWDTIWPFSHILKFSHWTFSSEIGRRLHCVQRGFQKNVSSKLFFQGVHENCTLFCFLNFSVS